MGENVNQQGLVTVIVPIYNVEKYLNRCINSIVHQSYQNLEILLIDDESPDNCPTICDTWADKDSRIRVIHKKNQGLGMARNTGLDNSHGDYICFVDSDDYIDLCTIEKAVIEAQKHAAEVVVFGMKKEDKYGKILSSYVPCKESQVYRKNSINNDFIPAIVNADYYGKRIVAGLSCCELLVSTKAVLRKNWRLASEREIISEDVYSLLRLYSGIESVVVIPEAFYHYCQNEGSLTKTYREDRWAKIKDFYDKCVRLISECNYPPSVESGICSMCISFIIGMFKTIANADISRSNKIKVIKEILNDKKLKIIVDGVDIRNQKKTWRLLIIIMKLKMSGVLLDIISLKS